MVLTKPIHSHRLAATIGIQDILLKEQSASVRDSSVEIANHQPVCVELASCQPLVAWGAVLFSAQETIVPSGSSVWEKQGVSQRIDMFGTVRHSMNGYRRRSGPNHQIASIWRSAISRFKHHSQGVSLWLTVAAHICIRGCCKAQRKSTGCLNGHSGGSSARCKWTRGYGSAKKTMRRWRDIFMFVKNKSSKGNAEQVCGLQIRYGFIQFLQGEFGSCDAKQDGKSVTGAKTCKRQTQRRVAEVNSPMR